MHILLGVSKFLRMPRRTASTSSASRSNISRMKEAFRSNGSFAHTHFFNSTGNASSRSVLEEYEKLKEKRHFTDDKKKRIIEEIHTEQKLLRTKNLARQRHLALIGIVTIVLGVIVNEDCAARYYMGPCESLDENPVQEAFDAGALCYTPENDELIREKMRELATEPCKTSTGEGLKIAITILTFVYVVLNATQWRDRQRVGQLEMRIRDQLYLPKAHVHEDEIPLRKYCLIILETLLHAIHPIPFVRSYWQFKMADGREVFYRFESLTVGVMFLRLYDAWRWLYLMAYLRFFDLKSSFLVKDQRTIEVMHLHHANVNARSFPLKVLIAKYPVRVISCVVGVLYLSVCYLMRMTEGPAYQPHSDDWWDQMWITITQGTTGYGGTEPRSQWGRFCAVLMMFIGPMTVSFVTATTTKNITLSQDENAMLQTLRRNNHKAKLMDAAVRLIQFWWWELRQNQALGNGDGAEDLASVVVMLKNVKASLGLTAKRARSLRSPVASASQPAAADNGAGVGPSDAETRSPARSHRRLSQSSAQGVSMTGTEDANASGSQQRLQRGPRGSPLAAAQKPHVDGLSRFLSLGRTPSMRKQMSMKRMTPRERRQKRITLLRAFYSELEEYERFEKHTQSISSHKQKKPNRTSSSENNGNRPGSADSNGAITRNQSSASVGQNRVTWGNEDGLFSGSVSPMAIGEAAGPDWHRVEEVATGLRADVKQLRSDMESRMDRLEACMARMECALNATLHHTDRATVTPGPDALSRAGVDSVSEISFVEVPDQDQPEVSQAGGSARHPAHSPKSGGGGGDAQPHVTEAPGKETDGTGRVKAGDGGAGMAAVGTQREPQAQAAAPSPLFRPDTRFESVQLQHVAVDVGHLHG